MLVKNLSRFAVRASIALAVLGGIVWTANGYQIPVSYKKTTIQPAVLTDKEAFILGKPEFITGATEFGKLEVSACPMGEYVAIAGARLDRRFSTLIKQLGQSLLPDTILGETSVITWNSRTMTPRTVWRSSVTAQSSSNVESIRWFAGTRKAVVVVRVNIVHPNAEKVEDKLESTVHLWILNAVSGTMQPIGDAMFGDMAMSPKAPIGIHTEEGGAKMADGKTDFDSFKTNLCVVNSNGTSIIYPMPDKQLFHPTHWGTDGYTLYASLSALSFDKNTPRKKTYIAINLHNGAITPIEKIPQDAIPDSEDSTTDAQKIIDALPVTLQTVASGITENDTIAVGKTQPETKTPKPNAAAKKSTAKLNLCYLESKTPGTDERRALVAADAEAVTLLPDASAALYTVRGSLFALPIVRMDKTAYLTGRLEAQKAVAISNAKQIGLGLLMYVQDYDDYFPNSGADVSGVIFPYIKNDDVFNNPATGQPGFVYTFTGSSLLKNMSDPANTQLGYVGGPGGRAVIYGDGHVRWVPDNP